MSNEQDADLRKRKLAFVKNRKGDIDSISVLETEDKENENRKCKRFT